MTPPYFVDYKRSLPNHETMFVPTLGTLTLYWLHRLLPDEIAVQYDPVAI